MSQKSNLTTIRTSSFNILSNNTKTWISIYQFVKSLKRIFNVKNVLTHDFSIHLDNNFLLINFYFFYQNIKLLQYKNRITHVLANTNRIFSFTRQKLLSKIFYKFFQKYKLNSVYFTATVLNRDIDKSFLLYFRSSLKNFNNLFTRRFNLFIDFIKVVVLFLKYPSNSNLLIYFLSKLFKFLSKRSHTKFLNFVKELFNSIIKYEYNKQIKGLRFLINGKIRGKDRSSSKLLQIGKLPLQSISKDVEFCLSHVYTIYGAFGFKLWVYKEKIH